MKTKKYFITMIFLVIIFLSFTNVSFASSDIIVALDPGHGGNDSGAIGGGLQEKNLTWKIASRVKEILDNTPGITGVLTKTENETVDSRELRAKRAKDNDADLLVSFHINSNGSSNSLSGAETYITRNTTQKRYYEYSNILGLDILKNLRNIGIPSFSPKPRTVKGADWDVYPDGTVADYYGIISWPMHMDIPAILVEHAFINNPYDREHYLNDTMLNKIAEADAQAIIKNKELFRREFYGTINTELVSLNHIIANGNKDYLQGYIYIAEWVNGDCRTPSKLPKLTLKSTDGTFSTDLYVGYEGGIKYYFDKYIGDLDINKEYYIEAQLTDSKNKETIENKTQVVKLPNKILNENYKDRVLKTVNNKLVFSEGEYKGKIDTKLKEIKLTENSTEETYISGEIAIYEIVEDNIRNPKSMPEIYIKSTDNAINEKVIVEYKNDSKYYFYKNIQNLDKTKEYYIEARLTSEDNIETEKEKKQIIQIGTKEVGKLNGITVTAKDDKFTITYLGTINTELTQMNIIQNSAGDNYISGKIYIAEWVDGKCKNPSTLPKMTLKSTDGKISTDMYVNYENGIEYYYDKNIQNIDMSKEYYIEVVLTDISNTAKEEEKTQKAKFSINTVDGKFTDGRKVQIVNDNHLKIIDESLYYGTINTELYDMKIIQNGAGDNYISGYIYIAEWVDGECKTPSKMPKMYLKSTDGESITEMYVGYEGGIKYYFDKNIENIDVSKEYYIEAVLTNPKNQADQESQKQVARITKQGTIGTCTNGKQVNVIGNNIKLKDVSSYYGTINTELYDMKIIQNGAGDNYISGYIYIAEWVDGECKTPSKMPKMYLKSTDGEFLTEMYVGYEGGIKYYFDKNIENIDVSKEYYIEAKLTNPKNQADKESQEQIARITKQGVIGICTNGNKVNTDGNKIMILNNRIKDEILDEEDAEAKIEESKDILVEEKDIEIINKEKNNFITENVTKEHEISNQVKREDNKID